MVSMADVVEGAERWHVQHADCLFALSCLPDACVDAIVTDPPYGIGSREPRLPEILAYLNGEELDTGGDFMAKRWSVPSVGVWQECLRVLKPGGHVLSFGGTRTFDLIALGLRAAGFQFRDTITVDGVLRWVQSQGMPHGLDIAKAIDRLLGVEPTIIGTRVLTGSAALSPGEKGGFTYAAGTRSAGRKKEVPITAPSSSEAQAWDGWDVALKPVYEPVLVFRKPLDGTVAENVLAHGTGGLNVGGCRVAVSASDTVDTDPLATSKGRWPPNALLCHLPGCRPRGTKQVNGDNRGDLAGRRAGGFADVGAPSGDPRPNARVYGDAEIPVYECSPGCPAAALDEQSGECPAGIAVQRNGGGGKIFGGENTRGAVPDSGYSDTGGAARFFPQFEWDPVLDGPSFLYVPKASVAERDAGLDDATPSRQVRLRSDLSEEQRRQVLAQLRLHGVHL